MSDDMGSVRVLDDGLVLVEGTHVDFPGVVCARTPEGVIVAHNTVPGSGIRCPVCLGVREAQAGCSECFGRGVIRSIPLCARGWDLVEQTPQGGSLFVGGHDSQEGAAVVADEFDLVVSLFTRDGHGPSPDIRHLSHRMADAESAIPASDVAAVERLAEAVRICLTAGERVLVRCQAGMNRSGLVAGLAMVESGADVDDLMSRWRAVRGPYVLFNDTFVDFLRSRAAGAAGRAPHTPTK